MLDAVAADASGHMKKSLALGQFSEDSESIVHRSCPIIAGYASESYGIYIIF